MYYESCSSLITVLVIDRYPVLLDSSVNTNGYFRGSNTYQGPLLSADDCRMSIVSAGIRYVALIRRGEGNALKGTRQRRREAFVGENGASSYTDIEEE